MELQEIEHSEFEEEIYKANNIYDIILAFFSIIDNKQYPTYEQVYAETRENKDDYFDDINLKIEEVVERGIGLDTFKESIVEIVDKNNARLYAFFILYKFEHILEEREEYSLFRMKKPMSVDVLTKVGALNSNNKKYHFYLMSNESLAEMSDALKQINMRYIDRISGYSIFKRIKSYRILPATTPNILIYGYADDYFKTRLALPGCNVRVAVAPIAKTPWYKMNYITNSKTDINFFEIEDIEENIDYINECYINILKKLNDEKVEIVIFPELAMNSKTEQVIKNYLIESSLNSQQMHSIKLVFCGSLWKNQENQCTLLSGSGSVLLKNSKRNPFEIKYNGIDYKERLKEISSEYSMIDIKGLGRIWYLICKDGLDDISKIHLENQYGITFEVISCYSKSISYFEKEAISFSENYKGITILANSCEPRIIENKNENDNKNKSENDIKINIGANIGFISLPATKNEYTSTSTAKLEYYNVNAVCCRCGEHCPCAQIFTLYPNELLEDEKIKSMKVICENFQSNH